MAKKKLEEIIATQEDAVDLKTVAIALVNKTIDVMHYARKSGDRDYIQAMSEYAIGDLVVNTSDVLIDEDCLGRVGTVLEIRDRQGEVEVRGLDGITRCVRSLMGTYLVAKGVKENVSA